MRALRIVGAVVLCLAAAAALGQTPVPPPVAEVADAILSVWGAAGFGQIPMYTSPDRGQQSPAIRRLVIIVHGYQRNAADYGRIIQSLVPDPDATVVVAPQFLATEDVEARGLPGYLHWQRELWASGNPAEGPASLSALDALDGLLARDAGYLPNLSQIVLVGFSAGGQLVQRYAIAGRGETAFGRSGIALRYVVGSPSSYVYFGDERPQGGNVAPFAGVAQCPQFNRWKYGFAGDVPPYVATAIAGGTLVLEQRYLERAVTYLVGAEDKDPNHRFLDKSCAAEAQGPDRLSRTLGFITVMRQRDGERFRHRAWTIPGAAHNAERVLGSACGRAVLFGDGDCSGMPGQEAKK